MSGESHTFARVLYNFAGRSSHELTISEGDRLRVLQKAENGWWVGEKNGAMGVFPGSYVEEETSMNESLQDLKSAAANLSLSSPTYVKALKDYKAVHGAQISFDEGQIFTLVEQFPTNWWKGEIDSFQGLFPKNLVEIVPEEEARRFFDAAKSKGPLP